MVGRPVHELEEQLTAPEVLEYRAYWKLKDAAEKKHIEAAKKQSGSSHRARPRPRRR